jgi:DNA-binding response OmpR family regulator
MAEPRILIVDDDPEVQEALRLAFAGQPWVVETATIASVALSRHVKQPYDLLIIDKHLPDLDGVELIRQLREGGDQVRIVVLTGYGSAASAVETLNLAIDAYLLKPFATIDVIETVTDALARPAAAAGVPPHLFQAESDPGAAGAAESAPPAEAPAPAVPSRPAFLVLLASAEPRARARLEAILDVAPEALLRAADVTEMMDVIMTRPLGLLVIQGALDAAEVVARVRARAPELPIVVVAEVAGLSTVTWLIELRITALLTDPLDSPLLARRLSEILGDLQERAGAAPGGA